MFGSLDGLLVPLGVVSGVAGGTSNSKIVVVAGVAEAFAGALSMGAGEYLSGKSEAQVHARRSATRRRRSSPSPTSNGARSSCSSSAKVCRTTTRSVVADKVTTSHRSWVNTMAEKELGLSAEPEGNALKDSLSMGASYLLASLVPLGPYLFLSVRPAFVLSVILTIVALFVIGLVKGRLAEMSLWRSVAEVVVIGVASAARRLPAGHAHPSSDRQLGYAARGAPFSCYGCRCRTSPGQSRRHSCNRTPRSFSTS